MRALLVIAILTGICLAESPFCLEIPASLQTQSEEDTTNNAIEFLKGFFEGIGESGDVNKLLKCAKDFENIFKKLIEALKNLKHMNLKKVIEGIKQLVSAIKQLMNDIKPCISGFKKLEKLIKALGSINIMKIALHIIAHPAKFIHAITDAIGGFTSKNFHKAGKGVGELLAIIFLGREVGQSNQVIEFVKGFLEGIGEKKDIDPLLKCIKEGEAIFKKILEGLEHIKKKKLGEIIKGVTILLGAMKELMTMLEPCASDFKVLKKLIDALKHPDIKKIALRVLAHISDFIADITQAINAFKSHDFHTAGKCVGAILKIIFISREEYTANDALEFVKGFLSGIGESGNVNNLEKCLKDMTSIFKKLLSAISHIKKMKLNDIIVGVTELIAAVKEFMAMLHPCMEGFNTLKKLVEKIAHPNIKKIAMRIFTHSSSFLSAITEAISGFSGHNYNKAGHGIGHLLKLMFL